MGWVRIRGFVCGPRPLLARTDPRLALTGMSARSADPPRAAQGTQGCEAMTLLSWSGLGSMTNGSIGTEGGRIRTTFDPTLGKSLGLGGSSWPEGLTLSAV